MESDVEILGLVTELCGGDDETVIWLGSRAGIVELWEFTVVVLVVLVVTVSAAVEEVEACSIFWSNLGIQKRRTASMNLLLSD